MFAHLLTLNGQRSSHACKDSKLLLNCDGGTFSVMSPAQIHRQLSTIRLSFIHCYSQCSVFADAFLVAADQIWLCVVASEIVHRYEALQA